MKYISFFLPTCIAILLIGCASSPTIQYNYAGNSVHEISPKIQIEATAFVGDTILADSSFYETDALYLKTPVGYGLYHFPSGYYSKIGSDQINNFYSPLSMNESGSYINQEGNARKYVQAIAVKKGTLGQICPIHAISGTTCIEANVKTKKTQSQKDDSFEKVLLYNGRVGDKINIGYREFTNDKARPAFNNNVEYDLSQSSKISYKGALIEVLNADNNRITYKIIKSFSAQK